MQLLPRLRGKILNDGNKFSWEAWFTIGPDDGDFDPINICSNKEFDSWQAADNDLRRVATEIMNEATQVIEDRCVTQLLDLKNNALVSAEEFSKSKEYE